MSYAPGTSFGPYQIVGLLGAGGMGEVYRAWDTRLERDVAVKVLPRAFAQDASRRERFEYEARTVAALSHANVVSVYDSGVHDGQLFVIMELLEGETLRQRLDTGALPISKATAIAAQVAQGLAAAHDKGLVHRDLKPENVFLLADGRVKILDFGLARQVDTGSGESATAAALTDPGVVMGTVGYMAPEQVRGQTVDARTDLFALGALLFEMLSGERAFRGDSNADTLFAIVREDPPDLLASRPTLSPALDRIVRHCLEKSPAERFQSARDVAFALEALSGSASGTVAVGRDTPGPRRHMWHIATLAAAAVALVVIGGLGTRAVWPEPVAAAWIGTELGGPAFASSPRISPDGTLAFAAMVDSNTQLAVMTPDSGDWSVLTASRHAGSISGISWSADGNTIYFGRRDQRPRGVFAVPKVGGPERLILADASDPVALLDGSLLVTMLNADALPRMYRFWPDQEGRREEFPVISEWFWTPVRALPDGRTVVAQGRLPTDDAAAPNQTYLVELGSGDTRRLVTGDDDGRLGSIAVTPDGEAVIGTIDAGHMVRVVRVAVDGRTRPRTLFTVTRTVVGLDVGTDGRIYAGQVDGPLVNLRFSPAGGPATLLGAVYNAERQFAGGVVLADGRLVVPGAPGGTPRLMVIEPGLEPRPLAASEPSRAPVASLGASEIVFRVGPPNQPAIAVASMANERVTQRIAFTKGPIQSLAPSVDGTTLYVGSAGTIWAQPIAGGEPRAIRPGDSAAVLPGDRLLIAHGRRLLVVPIHGAEGGEAREVLLTGPYALETRTTLNNGAVHPDGRRLLVTLISPDRWFGSPGVVDLDTGVVSAIPVERLADYYLLRWTPNGDVVAVAGDPRFALWRFEPAR